MAVKTKLTAATRIEKLLDNIAGGDNDVTPATRLEKFLSYIADAMEGGGGSGGGGDIPVYDVIEIPGNELPDGYTIGYYIDGDPQTIISSFFVLQDQDMTKVPVAYGLYEGLASVELHEMGESGMTSIYYEPHPILIDWQYKDKLSHLVQGSIG